MEKAVVTEEFAKDKARDDELIVVDGLDRQVGTATKEQAHREGLLHRAFSVMLVREGSHGPEFLLSRRSAGKYHSPGLWANSCCSHPRVGEGLVDAAYRRVREELGVEVQSLREIGSFIYRVEFENGLWEYEYDHVLVGAYDGPISPDPSEVDQVCWVTVQDAALELAKHPERFCAWAFTVLGLVLKQIGDISPTKDKTPAGLLFGGRI